jgi:Na+/H+ antiporter NhaC
LSQKAAIGPTVRSRLKYILPVAGVALVAFYISAGVFNESGTVEEAKVLGDPRGLPMLLVPALIIYLFLRGKHLLHGLMMGLLFGVVLGLVLGLLPVENYCGSTWKISRLKVL